MDYRTLTILLFAITSLMEEQKSSDRANHRSRKEVT